jgi:hypothetical protein
VAPNLQTHLQHVAIAEEPRTINIRLRPQLHERI